MADTTKENERRRLFRKGKEYFFMGEYALALRYFNELLVMYPGYISAYLYRGRCLMFLGDLDRAITDFTAAIVVNKRTKEAYVYRGVCYADRQEYGKALLDFDETLKIKHKNQDNEYYDDMALSLQIAIIKKLEYRGGG
jgi:tetratricopeptide (TPR) repeat protein